MDDANLIVLIDGTILVSGVDRTVAMEIGDPDYVLIRPFVTDSSGKLTPWLDDYTIETNLKIGSDKIITMTDPNSELLEKYIKLTK